jgi:glutathione S-transferase
MYQLWGRTSSINVRKVLWTLQELGIPFQRTDAGMAFGIVKTPAYRAKNPNALIPLLEEADGFSLWESNVIVRYLCARHATGTLYPEDLRARFAAERWMDWQQTTLNPAGRNAFMQLIRTAPEERRNDLIVQSEAATGPLLDMLEHQLAGQPYIAGDSLTMADIPIACEMHRWWGLPLAHAPHPRLRDWYARVSARAASRGVLDLPLS